MNAPEDVRCLDLVFLRDVVEQPGDDTPLLIYADWLMEQPDVATQARGEYLRLQCVLARTREVGQRRDLHWRVQQLWWNHAESWLGRLYPAVDHFLYERGRLCLEISEQHFCKVPSTELVAEPAWDWVTDIVVRKGSLDLLVRLGDMPRPTLLEGLDIGRRTLEHGELEYLLELEFWEGVPELSLYFNLIRDTGTTALAVWPGLAGVKHLDLRSCWIDNEGIQALAASPFLDTLERLDLSLSGGNSRAHRRINQRFGDRVRWW